MRQAMGDHDVEIFVMSTNPTSVVRWRLFHRGAPEEAKPIHSGVIEGNMSLDEAIKAATQEAQREEVKLRTQHLSSFQSYGD